MGLYQPCKFHFPRFQESLLGALQCLQQQEAREGFRGRLRAQPGGLDLGWLKQECGQDLTFAGFETVLVVTWERGKCITRHPKYQKIQYTKSQIPGKESVTTNV